MIAGGVNARHEAVVRLTVRGPDGTEAEVDAVIDTGFTASLVLPLTIVTSLGLPYKSVSRAVMADGSISAFHVHAAEVAWTVGWLPVLVSAVGNEALVGMRLLAGHELRVEVLPGGAVEIVPLP